VTDRLQDAPGDVAQVMDRLVRDVPDFPEPGVVFKDISPLLADHVAFAAVVDAMVAHLGRGHVDKVAGIEARGFLLGAPVAYHLGAGFVPVRKKGKLPRSTYGESYDLEYGAAEIEVHRDAFAPGERVLVVDDVLATGGTAVAALALVEQAGAVPVGLSVLMELTALHGREKLAAAQPDLELHTLLTF
jgi:adenine phosphoribosyltransferase